MWIRKKQYRDILNRISVLEKNQELFRDTVKNILDAEEALAAQLKEQIQELPRLLAQELSDNCVNE